MTKMSHIVATIEKNLEKPKNEFYKSDIKKTVQYTRWILEILGIWPMITKNPSRIEKWLSKILIIFSLMALAFPLVPIALVTIIRAKNGLLIFLRLGPISAGLASIIKLIFIILHSKEMKLCIEHMENDWIKVRGKSHERAIMLRNVKFGRTLTLIAAIFMYTGGIFYHAIMPILKGNSVNERNETIRPLVYPGFELFVDVQKSPTYEIIFYTTCVSGFVRYTINIASFNLAAVFVTHACGQIQIVMSRLDKLFDQIDDKSSNEQLQKRVSSVIHCHARGLRFSSRVNDVLREICLIEVVSATFLICLLEYFCITMWSKSDTVAIITYFLFLLSYVFNVFIFCYIGDRLKEQCFEVGKSTYLIDWYRFPGRTGLAIVMILAMANYPRKLTAGRMLDLSLVNFGIIMKTSLMYLNMVRALIE